MKKEIETEEEDEIEEVEEDEDEAFENAETKAKPKTEIKPKFVPKKKETDRYSAFHLPERVGILDNATQKVNDDIMSILAGIKNDLFEIKQSVEG